MKKVEKFVFFFLVLFLPTQLGKHFWPEFSYVFGRRIDYLSPTIYLTDILIGILFLLNLKKNYEFLKRNKLFACLIVLLSFFWVYFQGQQPGLLLYKWLKLFEFLFLIYWIRNKVDLKTVILPLNLSVLWTSLLAWAQFFKQRSLGFWLLGERSFHMATPGIALGNWQGRLFLRPYAVFPHPNVLAGYFLVVFILNLFLYCQLKKLRWLVLFISTATIIICFSRTVWIAWLLIMVLWLIKRK